MFKTNVCFVLCQQHVNMSENQNLGFLGKPRLFTWDLRFVFFSIYIVQWNNLTWNPRGKNHKSLMVKRIPNTHAKQSKHQNNSPNTMLLPCSTASSPFVIPGAKRVAFSEPPRLHCRLVALRTRGRRCACRVSHRVAGRSSRSPGTAPEREGGRKPRSSRAKWRWPGRPQTH